MSRPDPEHERTSEAIEEYADGEIHVRRGIVNRWLLVVYVVLFGWGVYYLFAEWGGLGPGLAR